MTHGLPRLPQSDAVAHHRTTSPRTIVDAGRNCQATSVGIRHDRSSRRWPLWEWIDGKATCTNGRPGMADHPDPGTRKVVATHERIRGRAQYRAMAARTAHQTTRDQENQERRGAETVIK